MNLKRTRMVALTDAAQKADADYAKLSKQHNSVALKEENENV
jgi:hypothetical protein